MFSKNIYIVRHGETILNKQHIRQGEGGELSDTGRKQAFETGLRLSTFKIKNILCSPLKRAAETCEEINKTLNLNNIIYTPLLSERRNPTNIVGLKYDDPAALSAIGFMDKSFHADNARLSDEENFIDLKTRAERAIEFIARHSSSNTLCVTHGVFLKALLSVIIKGGGLTEEEYVKMSIFNPADNAGLTILKYEPLNIFKNKWSIVIYNDKQVDASSMAI